MESSLHTLDELKGFIGDENRDFSNVSNFIYTIRDVEKFLESIKKNESPSKILLDCYEFWIEMIMDFPPDEFICMCHYSNGDPKWEV